MCALIVYDFQGPPLAPIVNILEYLYRVRDRFVIYSQNNDLFLNGSYL